MSRLRESQIESILKSVEQVRRGVEKEIKKIRGYQFALVSPIM